MLNILNTSFSAMPLKTFLQCFFIWSSLLIATGCNGTSQSENQDKSQNSQIKAGNPQADRKYKPKNYKPSDKEIPKKVLVVLSYVREHGRAPDGYMGGRKFGNFERRLPLKGEDSKPMKYREWDVNPKKPGKNRGAERLITSEDERAWYTRDHYDTFVEIR